MLTLTFVTASQAGIDAAAMLESVALQLRQLGTYRVSFEQAYESTTFGREIQGRGEVIVVGDGRMVWTYSDPKGRYGAYSGAIWWMVDPEDQQVIVREGAEVSNGPLGRILAGHDLSLDGFQVAFAAATAQAQEDQVIELRPTAPRDDVEVVQVEIASGTRTLRRVSVVDPLGNKLSFRFGAPRKTTIPPAQAFTLIVPNGYDVSRE
jgi:outer membrane lipoprotein-sorting protein